MRSLFTKVGGNVLLLDWDGTLTTRSTLGLIATIRPDALALSTFTAAYEADLKRHAARWNRARRTTLEDERKYAESLKAVELTSIERLEAGGVWKGVTGPPLRTRDGTVREATERGPYDVEKAAKEAVSSGQLELRPGATTLLRTALRRRDHVFIVSVAWSGSWIAACLREMGVAAWSAAEERAKSGGAGVVVLANEIDPTGSGQLGRGYVGRMDWPDWKMEFDRKSDEGIWTAVDKHMVANIFSQGLRKGSHAVCLGDSLGDLQMLLRCSDGASFFVVDDERTGEQRELEEALDRLQIEVRDIEEHRLDESSDWDRFRVTEDLTPVVNLLYGVDG